MFDQVANNFLSSNPTLCQKKAKKPFGKSFMNSSWNFWSESLPKVSINTIMRVHEVRVMEGNTSKMVKLMKHSRNVSFPMLMKHFYNVSLIKRKSFYALAHITQLNFISHNE